jgi:hypothetical protein
MIHKSHIAAAMLACGLLAAPSAVAKDFRPGDLRICGRDRCVAITNAKLLRTLSDYYWRDGRAPRSTRVALGAPGFELRDRGGYPSGMVAPRRLDRFRAYGFNCGRFERGQWYRFPARAALALRKVISGLRPLRVSPPPRSC